LSQDGFSQESNDQQSSDLNNDPFHRHANYSKNKDEQDLTDYLVANPFNPANPLFFHREQHQRKTP
jgi:hypothetical protein